MGHEGGEIETITVHKHRQIMLGARASQKATFKEMEDAYEFIVEELTKRNKDLEKRVSELRIQLRKS